MLFRSSGQSYEIWRRWSECQKLDNGCYALPRRVKPAYNLRFPGRTFRAGSDRTALNNRRSDLAVYFKKFAKWINEVLDKSECQMDLMTGDGVADPQQVIKTFFDARASDVNLTETKATLKFTPAQIVAMRQGAQEFAAQETRAINADSD